MMSKIPDIWQIDLSGLLIASQLAISFQRYPLPADGVLGSPSPSFGALPIGSTRSGRLLFPIVSGEAFWMGFTNCDESIPLLIRIAVETSTGGILDASAGTDWRDRSSAGIVVPPQRELDGIVRLAGGWWPLTGSTPNSEAPQCTAITIAIVPQPLEDRQSPPEVATTLRLESIDSCDFFESTGVRSPPPLDLTAAYGGWLLP
jgi:hypothetical protein